MVSLVDDNVGRILDVLQETGLAETTIVVFTSDHGDYLGDHGMYGKGLPYDGAIQVPLIFRGPGVRAGQRFDGIASTLDVAPTLLDMLGIDEPEGVQGCSLKGALDGRGEPDRRAALTENDDDFVPMKMRTLTTDDWKLTYYCGKDFGELYDRTNDPDELVNLWSDEDYADRKAELMDMLVEEVMCSLDVSNGRRQEPRPTVVKWVPRHNSRQDGSEQEK